MAEVNANNQVTGTGAASGTTGTSQTTEPNIITGEGEVTTTTTASGDSVTISSGSSTTETTAVVDRNWAPKITVSGYDLLMVDLWQEENEFVDFCISMPTYDEKQAMIARYKKDLLAYYEKALRDNNINTKAPSNLNQDQKINFYKNLVNQNNITPDGDPPVNRWNEITSDPQYARWKAGDVYRLPSGYGTFSGHGVTAKTTQAERDQFQYDLAREQMIVGCCRKLMDLMALFVAHEEAKQGLIDTMISMMFGRKITSQKEVLDAIGEGMAELLETLSKRLFEVISEEMERLADLRQQALDECAAYWDNEKNWYDSFTGDDPEGEKLKEQAAINREYEADLQALENIVFKIAKALLPDTDLGVAIDKFFNNKNKWIKKADGDYMDTDKKFILKAQKAIMDIQQAQETKEAFEDAKQGLVDTIMQVQFGLEKTGSRGQSLRRKRRKAIEQFAVQMMHQCVNIVTQRIKAHNDAVQKEEEYNYHRANNRSIGGLSMKAWKSGWGMLVSPVLGLALCIYGNSLDDTVHNRPVEELTKEDIYEIWGDRSALITEYVDALIKLLNDNKYIEEIEMEGTDETMWKIDYKEFEKAADEVYDINKREQFELAVLTALQDLIDTIMQVNWQISADKSAINLQMANVNRRMVMTQAMVGTIRTIMEDKVAEHNRMAMHNINEMMANIGIGSEILKVVGTVLSVVGACLICTPAAAVGAVLIIVGVVANVVAAVIDKVITSIKEAQAEALEEASRDGNEDLVDPSNPDADLINGMTYNNTTKWEEGDDVPIVGTIEYRNLDSAAVMQFADALSSRLASLSFAMAVENAKADLVDTIISMNFDIQTSGNALNKRLRQMKLSQRSQRTIELFNTRFQQIMNQLEAVNKLVMAQTEDKMASYSLAFSIVGAALKAIPYVGAAISVATDAVQEVIQIVLQMVITAVQLLLEILLEEAKKRNEEQLKEIMEQVKKQLDEAMKSQEGKKDPASEMIKQIIRDIIEHGLLNAGDLSVVNSVTFAKARQNLNKVLKLMEFQAKVESAKAALTTAIMQNIDGRLAATDITSMQINMRQSLVRNFVNTMIQAIRHNQQQISDIKAANKAAEKAIIMKAVMGAINIVAQSISLAGAVKNVKLEARADAKGLGASKLTGQDHAKTLNSVKTTSDFKFDAAIQFASITMRIVQMLTPVIMEIAFHEAEKADAESDEKVDKQLDTNQTKKSDKKALDRKAAVLKAQIKAMRHQSSDQLFQSLFMKAINSIGTTIQLAKSIDSLGDLNKSIKAMEKYGSESISKRIENKTSEITSIKDQIAAATAAGDSAKVAELNAKLTQLNSDLAKLQSEKDKINQLTTNLKSMNNEDQRTELKMMLDASSRLANTQTTADQIIMEVFNDQARVEKGLAEIQAQVDATTDPSQKATLTNQLAVLTQQKQENQRIMDNLATITKGEKADVAADLQSQLAATLGKVAMMNTSQANITSINDLVTSQAAAATGAAINANPNQASLTQTMTTLMNNCQTDQAKQNLARSVITNQNLTAEQKTTVLSAMAKSDAANATAVSKALVTEVRTNGQQTETANLMGKMFEKSPDVVANAVSQLDSKQQTQFSSALQVAIDKTPQQGAMQSNMIEMQQLVNSMMTNKPTEATLTTIANVAKTNPEQAITMANTIAANSENPQATKAEIANKLMTTIQPQANQAIAQTTANINTVAVIAAINVETLTQNGEIKPEINNMISNVSSEASQVKPEEMTMLVNMAASGNQKVSKPAIMKLMAIAKVDKPDATIKDIPAAILSIDSKNVSTDQKAALLTAIAKSDTANAEAVSTALTSQVTNTGKQTEISNIMGKIYEKAPDVVANAMTQMSTEQKASLDSTFTDMIKSPAQQGPMQSTMIEMQLLLNASSKPTTEQTITTLAKIAEKNPDQAAKIANILINQQTTQEAKQELRTQITNKLEAMITPKDGKPIKDSAKNMNIITTLAKVSPETVKNNQNIKNLVNTALKQDASAEQIKMLATIATSQCGETSTIAATSLANSAGISLDPNNITQSVSKAIISMENKNMTFEQKQSILTSMASTDKASAETVSYAILSANSRNLSDSQKASILTAIAKTDSTNAEAVSNVLTSNLTNEATQQQTSFVMGKMVESAPDVFANITQNIETDKQANITAAFDNLNIQTQQQGAMQSNMAEMKQLIDGMRENNTAKITQVINNVAKNNPVGAANLAETVISKQNTTEAQQALRAQITTNLTAQMATETNPAQKLNIATSIALISPDSLTTTEGNIKPEIQTMIDSVPTDITNAKPEEIRMLSTMASSNNEAISKPAMSKLAAISGVSKENPTIEDITSAIINANNETISIDQKATILTAIAQSNTANAEAVSKTLVSQFTQAGEKAETAIQVMGKIHEKTPEVATKAITLMTETQKTNFSTALQTAISTPQEGPMQSNLIEMQQLLNKPNSDTLLNQLTNQIVSTQNDACNEIINNFSSKCAQNISPNRIEQGRFIQQVQSSMIQRAVDTNPTDPAQMALLDNFVSNAKQSSDPQLKELGLQIEKIADSKKIVAEYCEALQNAENPKVKVSAILTNGDLSPEQKAEIIRFGSGGDVELNNKIQSATQEFINNMPINKHNVETIMHLSSNSFSVHKTATAKLNDVIEKQPDIVKTIINNKSQHVISLQSKSTLETKQHKLFKELQDENTTPERIAQIQTDMAKIGEQLNQIKVNLQLTTGYDSSLILEQENQDALLTSISHVSEKNMTTVCLGLSAKDAATIVFKTPDRNLLGEWIYGDKKDVAADIIKQHAENGDTQKANEFATTLKSAVKSTVENYQKSMANANDGNTKAAIHKQLNILSDMEAAVDKATAKYLSGDAAINQTPSETVQANQIITKLNQAQSTDERREIIEASVLNNQSLSGAEKANIMLAISKSNPNNAKAAARSLETNLKNSQTQEQTAFVMGKMYEKSPEVVASVVNQLDSDSIKEFSSSLNKVSTREMRQQGPIHDATTIEMKQLIKAMASGQAEDIKDAAVKIGESNPQSLMNVIDVITEGRDDAAQIKSGVKTELLENIEPKNKEIRPTAENINTITALATLDPSSLLISEGEDQGKIKPEILTLITAEVKSETKTEQTQMLVTLSNHTSEAVSGPAKNALNKIPTDSLTSTISETYKTNPQKAGSMLTGIAMNDQNKAAQIISNASKTNPEMAKDLTIGLCNALNSTSRTQLLIRNVISAITDKTILEEISNSPDLPATAKESIATSITIKENGVVFQDAVGTKGAIESITFALNGKTETEKEAIIKTVLDSEELSPQQKATILSGVAKNDPTNAPAISKGLAEMAKTEGTKAECAFIMSKMYEEAPDVVAQVSIQMNKDGTEPSKILEGIQISDLQQKGPLSDETVTEMKQLLEAISAKTPETIAEKFAILARTNPEQAQALWNSLEGHEKKDEIKQKIIETLTSSFSKKFNKIELTQENLNTMKMIMTIDPGSMIVDGSTTNEIKPEFVKLFEEPISTELKSEQVELLCMASCNPTLSKGTAPQIAKAYKEEPQLILDTLTKNAENNPEAVAGAIKQLNLIDQTAAREISINILNSLKDKEVSLSNFINEMRAQNSDLTEELQKPSPLTSTKPVTLKAEILTLLDSITLDEPIVIGTGDDAITILDAGKFDITTATNTIKDKLSAQGADKNRIINSILDNTELSAEDKASLFTVLAKDHDTAEIIAISLSNRIEQTGRQFEVAHIMGEMYEKAPEVFVQAISEMNETSIETTKAFIRKVVDIDMETRQQGRVYDGSAIEMQHLLKSILLEDEMKIIQHYLDAAEKYELTTLELGTPPEKETLQLAPKQASDMLRSISDILTKWKTENREELIPVENPEIDASNTQVRTEQTGGQVAIVPNRNEEEIEVVEQTEQIDTTEGFQARFVEGALNSPDERVSKFRTVALRAPQKAGLILTEINNQVALLQTAVENQNAQLTELTNLRGTEGAPEDLETQITQLEEQIKQHEDKQKALEDMKTEFFSEIKRNAQVLSNMLDKGNLTQKEKAEIITDITSQPDKFGYDVMTAAIKGAFTAPGTKLPGLDKDFSLKVMEYVLDNVNHDNYTQANELMETIVTNERKTRVKQFMDMAIQKDKVDLISNKNISITLIRTGFPTELITSLKTKLRQSDRGSIYDRLINKTDLSAFDDVSESNLNKLQSSWGVVIDDLKAKRLADLSFMLLNEHTEVAA